MSAPFFSVIITSYNRVVLLKRALNSLFAQTENDWEAILIDDGSTDGTQVEMASFLKKRKQLHCFWQENTGVIGAKNKGISLARGRYLTFLDADDEYKPTHLQIRKKALTAQPEIDLWHGGVEIIGNQYVPDCYHPQQKIHLSACAISGTFFVKRAAIRKLKGFGGNNLTTDADFMERARQQKMTIKKIANPTYIYHREGDDSITKKLTDIKD